VLIVVLFVTIQIVVLNPVKKLKDHFVQVAKTDDMTLRLSLETGDEFGTLCKQFDHMVGKLADARKTLMEQSYRSGISEMASGALHNVRNALTHVTTEIGCLANKANNTPLEHLQRAKDELQAGDCDPQREHELNDFIEVGNKSIFDLVASFRTGLADVTVPINRIEQMLADQDKVSHAEQPLETFRIDELLAEVIKMMPREMSESITIEVGESLEGKTIKANRISLVQIFSNLLLNAAEAIEQDGRSDGKIIVELGTRDKNGIEISEFVVTDNGTGIANDDLGHIFESGYSTKKGEHSGLGLHWCANTLNAVGGNIYAENCTEEIGASFHVLMPQND
jgi:nitrogen fixation/metabolism regulation signal transduction histidine kinase